MVKKGFTVKYTCHLHRKVNQIPLVKISLEKIPLNTFDVTVLKPCLLFDMCRSLLQWHFQTSLLVPSYRSNKEIILDIDWAQEMVLNLASLSLKDTVWGFLLLHPSFSSPRVAGKDHPILALTLHSCYCCWYCCWLSAVMIDVLLTGT